MEIVLAALVAAGVAVAVVLLVQRPRAAVAGRCRECGSGGPSRSAGAEAREPAAARATGSRRSCSRGAPRSPAWRSACARRRARSRSRSQQLAERERSLEDRRRNLDHAREELKQAKAQPAARARARGRA